jgi:hypothetical protein
MSWSEAIAELAQPRMEVDKLPACRTAFYAQSDRTRFRRFTPTHTLQTGTEAPSHEVVPPLVET